MSVFPTKTWLFFGFKKAPMPMVLAQFLTVALILCPLFLAIVGVAWLESLREDFPDESTWAASIWAVVGFFMAFPLLLATGFNAPFGLPHTAYIFVGVAMDGLFWAFAGVYIYRLFSRLSFRKQLSDESGGGSTPLDERSAR
jgi:hypothetical protein